MKKKWVNEAYITYILVAINCIVFVILEIMGDTESSEFMASVGAVWPPYIQGKSEYWRLFFPTPLDKTPLTWQFPLWHSGIGWCL